VKYAMMKELQEDYPVSFMGRIYDVSPSGYYAWLGRPPSKRAQEGARLEVEIRAAHQRTRETYGPERLKEDLAENGVSASVHRIKRIRQKLGIRCKQHRRFKATTNSNHTMPIAPNVLEQKFTATAPNQIWLTDITYIPTDEGWLYLAGHKDLFSGDLVGYAMSERMTKSLVSQSLFRGVTAKRPPRGLIHHSDRGSQFCAYEYRDLLDKFGMVASMSRRGNCYDNAPMESFWGLLKNELVYHRRFATRAEATQAITEYIEIFYRRQRKQARLGYLSPVAFERQFYEKRLAA
jgi:putative transposase